jgi:hypothetical protein
MATLSPEDLAQLGAARRVLETPSFAIRLTDLVGRPLDGVVRLLPDEVKDAIARGTRRALETSLRFALDTLDLRSRATPADWLNRAVVMASGAAGGVAGLTGFLLELPFSLTVMLRSIGDHARAQGEDLGEVAARLECLTVFAYGSRRQGTDTSDSAYFATRAMLGRAVSQAATFAAERGAVGAVTDRSAPALVALVSGIAQRLGVDVADKAAAQFMPVLGAAGGAAINALFITHYQETARAHFTIRRLERAHGREVVHDAYAGLG